MAMTLSYAAEDGGCKCACSACPSSDTLDIVISGYIGCGCFSSTGNSYSETSHTGITGAFTATGTGGDPGSWGVVIGTINLDKFTDGSNCIGFIENDQFDVAISIACANGILTANIGITGPIGQALFFNTGALDVLIPNDPTITCDGNRASVIGSVTISLPIP